MPETAVRLILSLVPALVGGVIAALNSDQVNGITERAEAWIRRRQRGTSTSNGWFLGYVVNPVLWTTVAFCNWTDGFSHRGLKNGVRVAAALYIIAAWLFALYVAFIVVVALVIAAAALYVAFKVFLGGADDSNDHGGHVPERSAPHTRRAVMDPDELRSRRIVDGDGTYRVDPESGVVQKQGTFGGWSDTDTRVDPESGVVQTQGSLGGWNDTDTRVDPESGVAQKQGPLGGWSDTETRVDPKSGVVQKQGIFGGWNNTDERIDPDTGTHQVRGSFGSWRDRDNSTPALFSCEVHTSGAPMERTWSVSRNLDAMAGGTQCASSPQSL